MVFTRRVSPAMLALTILLLFTAACSTGLPPVIRGPEAPAATALPPPPQPTLPAPVEVAPTPVAAPKIEATAAVTETVSVETSPVMSDTVAAEPTPAITVISGEVTYRQRIALAPDAVVEVLLQDTSRADAPAITLGSQTIATQGALVPLPYAVEYNLSQIDPAGLYAMRATIREGGKLTWTSTNVIPVITRGAPTDQVEIVVQPVSGVAQAKKEMGTLEGVVTYLESIGLPPNAVVEVTLQDVSLADAPAKVIARQIIESNGKQVPIDFALEYDPAAINPAMRYSVMARITVDGKLTWISTTINPVLTRGAPVNNVEIIVQPVAGS